VETTKVKTGFSPQQSALKLEIFHTTGASPYDSGTEKPSAEMPTRGQPLPGWRRKRGCDGNKT
jgi:hypothetical protein